MRMLTVLLIGALFVSGCKDMGDEPAGPPRLSLSQSTLTLVVGDSIVLSISGGTPPYAVTSRGDTTIASAALTGSSLRIRALGNGNSAITVGDNGSPPQTASLAVTVGGAISFSAQVQPVLDAGCVNRGCHPGGGAPFPLSSGQSYSRLVNQPTTTGSCTGLMRVRPFRADSSSLYLRLVGSSCGVQMPLTGAPLAPGDIDVIRNWITQGAPDN